MTAAALLDRVADAGATASLDPDGRVRIAGASRLPAELLGLLRQNREAVAEALARRLADPADAAELAAMAEHYAAPPDPDPWRPGDPDPLADGLLAGWHAGRVRLAVAIENLQAARPKRTHGVRALDWDKWEAAGRDAAGQPGAAWSTWRNGLAPAGEAG